MFKSITVIIIACIVLFSSPANAKTLKLVTLQYPPYVYEENGEIIGLAVNIVREAFRRLEQPIEIKMIPWARAIRMIKKGKADAIFTAYKTPEREQFAIYSQEILIPQVISLFTRTDSNIPFDGDLNTVKNYHFGLVRGVSYGSVFDSALKNNIIQNAELSCTGKQNLTKLMAKRFDILVSNRLGALFLLKQAGIKNQVCELVPAIQNIPSYIAFSKKKNLTLVRDRFDKVLANMKMDGTYDKMIKQYIE